MTYEQITRRDFPGELLRSLMVFVGGGLLMKGALSLLPDEKEEKRITAKAQALLKDQAILDLNLSPEQETVIGLKLEEHLRDDLKSQETRISMLSGFVTAVTVNANERNRAKNAASLEQKQEGPAAEESAPPPPQV
jgi:hypothetical protein